MNLKLPSSILTKQDTQTLILDIKLYARWFSHVNIKKRLKVKRRSKSSEQPDISEAASQLIHDWSIQKPVSSKSLDELISALESFLQTAPQLTIALAAPPPSKTKESLVNWCRNNIAPNILVNFQFDSSILGGLIIRYGSHLYDWSFKRQIMQNRNKFAEILRNV